MTEATEMKKAAEMTEELNIRERIVLEAILPQEGDATTLRIIRKLREQLAFSEEEVAEWVIRREGTMVHWKDDLGEGPTVVVQMGPRARTIIAESLDGLNAAKKLRAEHLDLYDRFAGEAG